MSLWLTYLGCEGVLVRAEQGTVLIDGLFGPEAAPFAMAPGEALDALRHARPPFAGVDVLIATHYHGDHFNADAVADHLRAHRRSRFVSTPQAVGRLIDVVGPAFVDRVQAVPALEGSRETIVVNGVEIGCFGLSHGRVNYADVENMGVVVRLGGRTVLHLGDGIIDEKALRGAGVLDEIIDVGVLPFWFLTYPFGRRLLQSGFRPASLFGAHIRVSEREQIVREIEATRGAVPLTEPLARYRIETDGQVIREA